MIRSGRGVEIGAAAAAGLLRGLVDDDRDAGLRQPDGRGKAGKSGADDMDVFRHQMIRVTQDDRADADACGRRGPARAARAKPRSLQQLEDRRIGFAMIRGACTAGARLRSMIASALREMRPRARATSGAQTFGEPGSAIDLCGSST